MATTIRAIITPEILVWARSQIRLRPDVAAKKAGVSEERLAEWERGESQPTIRQARLLASALKQPFASFFLPAPPETPLRVPHDYRRLAGVVDEGPTSGILLSVQDAWRRREIALELLNEAGAQPATFELGLQLTDDPELAGTQIRELLAVSLGEQAVWQSTRLALNGWRRAADAAGILIFQAADIELREFRGFSLAARPLPVVVVNRKDAYAGRAFTLLHEVCHILLNNDGLCDLTTENERSREERAIEVFCNASAAACLMPANHVVGHRIISREPSRLAWPDEQIEQLARHFSVSKEALIRRLLTLGRTTQEFYEQKRRQYEEEAHRQPERKGFLSPPQDALSKLGRSFVGLVLESYGANRLTSSDASDYLGVRLKHFPTLVDALRGE